MQEKGQTLVIKLLHASVFDLSSYMQSDVADVIIELTRNDADLMSKWLEEAIKTMPSQNAGGAPTATPDQLLEFHSTVTRYATYNFISTLNANINNIGKIHSNFHTKIKQCFYICLINYKRL